MMYLGLMKEELLMEKETNKRQFYAMRLQRWYRAKRKLWYETHNNPRSFYVIKCFKDSRTKIRLSNQEIVREHIGSVLYRLLGIKTPDIRIIPEFEKNQVICSIASQYLNGYKDLYKILSEQDEDLLCKLDEAVTQPGVIKKARLQLAQKRRNDIFKSCFDKTHLKIDKESLLIAAVLLMESDVIGAGFSNIGILLSDDNEKTLVKIDTGRVDLKSGIDDFKKEVSLKHPLIFKSFSMNFLNDPNMLFIRDLHLNEFFQDVSIIKIKEKIKALGRISDNEIKKHIVRSEYNKLVSKKTLQNYAQNIIDRKHFLVALLHQKSFFSQFSCFSKIPEVEEGITSLPLQPVFAKRSDFSIPVHTIDRGASNPVIVYKKSDESSIKQVNRFTIKNLDTS